METTITTRSGQTPMLDVLYLAIQLAKAAALVLVAYAFTYLMLAI